MHSHIVDYLRAAHAGVICYCVFLFLFMIYESI